MGGSGNFPVIFKASVRTAGSLIAAYGLYVFWKRNFIDYLFLRSEFVFMDYGEPVVLFYLEYLALMGFFVFISDRPSDLPAECTDGNRTEPPFPTIN